jgi:hypothetical protein
MFFPTPTPDDIAACVRSFIAEEQTFSPEACRVQASRFSPERFRAEFMAFVEETMETNRRRMEPVPPRKTLFPTQSRQPA